jgi:tetratricopeptide (TPR) repeat protein
MRQIFVLAADCDSTQLRLTAAEGYLLSRIDGTTPWRLLREMGGIPASDVDACLERWLEQGILAVVGDEGGSGAKRAPVEAVPDPEDAAASEVDAAAAPESTFVPRIDESAFEEGLDIDLATQRRVLEFEASLGRPYHELLGVAKGSDPKVVKRAYFTLSKEFHPDRYFRREIGGFGARLDRIFKKVLEAYEMLSDPDLCQVENRVDPMPQEAATESVEAAGANASETPASEAVPPPPRALTKLERLRQRMPFKIDHAGMAARRAKAQEIFRAAERSQQAGRLKEAEASIRIAISFDPGRAEFKEALGSIRIQAAGARATKLLAGPSERMSDGDLREALTLLEDVLIYRPHDPQLNERAAQVCLKLGKLDSAVEYAQTLLERSPDVAPYHTLLGRIHRERGDKELAVRAFEAALKCDEEELEARRALASMRIGARDAVRGGKS